MIKESHEAESALTETRQKAIDNGNLLQIEIMKEKMRQSNR